MGQLIWYFEIQAFFKGLSDMLKFWKNSVLYFLWYKDQNVRWNLLLQLLALIRTKILRHEIPPTSCFWLEGWLYFHFTLKWRWQKRWWRHHFAIIYSSVGSLLFLNTQKMTCVNQIIIRLAYIQKHGYYKKKLWNNF